MAKDEEQAEGSGTRSTGSTGSGSGSRSGSRSAGASTSTHAPSNTSTGTGDPNPSDHSPMIGGREVVYAPDEKSADTFRKPVVLEGPADPNDPGQNLVRVTKEVIEEFHHMGEKRTSRRMVMAAGTLTTRRLAEEAGVKDYEEYRP